MDEKRLEEILRGLRIQEQQLMLNLAHVQGRIIMAEEILAQEGEDANPRSAA